MKRQDFFYDLPKDLIASQPTAARTGSRLLCLDGVSGQVAHKDFPDLVQQLRPGDVLVFNNTQVIPARLFGQKLSGGKVEILVERILSDHEALAHVRASKSPKAGANILLENGKAITVLAREGELSRLDFCQPVMSLLQDIGHMPLPPYINRDDTIEDQSRYQTVYGTEVGAVAAPTAGLHFDEALLDAITHKGIETAFVTLHVGAGTFQPVRVDDIQDHVMHSEWMTLNQEVSEQLQQAKVEGRRVIAVGTTSVRCLETAAQHSAESISPYEGETDIFIYPGYDFKMVDALITNFHLPESTLLMLVSAFAGYTATMAAYREAIAQSYRFFSYGDAMYITRNPQAVTEKIIPK